MFEELCLFHCLSNSSCRAQWLYVTIENRSHLNWLPSLVEVSQKIVEMIDLSRGMYARNECLHWFEGYQCKFSYGIMDRSDVRIG